MFFNREKILNGFSRETISGAHNGLKKKPVKTGFLIFSFK